MKSISRNKILSFHRISTVFQSYLHYISTVFLLYCIHIVFFSNVFSLDIGVNVSTGSGEVGKFATFNKNFYGDYFSSPEIDTTVYYSSATMLSEILSDGATSFYTQQEIIPGNSYYYFFSASYGGVTIVEPQPRIIYVSPEWKGLREINIWNNFLDAPPKNYFSKLEIIQTIGNQLKINLEWHTPTLNNIPLLDLFGGGYEIWRSTYSTNVSSLTFNLVATVPVNTDKNFFQDTDIIFGGTYYYSIRSYDAYTKFLYSDFSESTMVVVVPPKEYPVKLIFSVDVSKMNNVKTVSLTGDFLYPEWGKINFRQTSPGIWSAEYYNEFTCITGKVIKYKYIINDSIIEPRFKKLGQYRTLKLEDNNSDGIININDIWGVPSIKIDVPEEIGFFSVLSKSNGVKLLWNIIKDKINDIETFVIYKNVGQGYVFVSSTTNNYFVDTDTSVPPNTEYKLSVVRKKPGETVNYITSEINNTIPKSQFLELQKINVVPAVTLSTGTIKLLFNVAEQNETYGEPIYSLISIATFTFTVDSSSIPIEKFVELQKLTLVSKTKLHHSGSNEEILIPNLGEGCPGYYFVVSMVYGNNEAIGVINPVLGIAPYSFENTKDIVVKKNSYTLGTEKDCNTELRIKSNSLKGNKFSSVIKNYYELVNSDKYTNIIEANNKINEDYRIKMLPSNIISGNNTVNTKNAVFGFNVYDENLEDYFTNKKSVREMEIIIPYGDLMPLSEDNLIVCRLNEKNNFWQIFENYEIDKTNKIVKIKTKSLSVYGLFLQGDWPKDLSELKVYPNPFVPYDGNLENGEIGQGDSEYESINFINLTRNAKIFIYNIAGDIVFKTEDITGVTNTIGKWRWNIKNNSGKEVSSGVYLYLIKDETITSGKNKVTGKFSIVR